MVDLIVGIRNVIGFTRNEKLTAAQEPGDLMSYDLERMGNGNSFFLCKYNESLFCLMDKVGLHLILPLNQKRKRNP